MAIKQTYITDAKTKGRILDRLEYHSGEAKIYEINKHFYKDKLDNLRIFIGKKRYKKLIEENANKEKIHKIKKNRLNDFVINRFVNESSKLHLQKVAVRRKLFEQEIHQRYCEEKAENPNLVPKIIERLKRKADTWESARFHLSMFAQDKGFSDDYFF